MAAFLKDSRPTVQVYSPTLAEEALICTFESTPSGSYLIRTVSQADFTADKGQALLSSLSSAVESILGEGIATSAVGTQGVDDSGLIFDAVTFTVEYVPTVSTPGRILGDVQIPVNVLTLDTQFTSGTGVVSAPELILNEYNRLKALAGE